MPPTDAVRFIIITTPQREVAARIEEARRTICGIGASRAALAYPPHVTLRTGTLVPALQLADFVREFGEVVGRWKPFRIRTDGLWQATYRDREQMKHLVGYRIHEDPELMAMNERLLTFTRWRASNRLRYEPHLTLAFDDLNQEGFARIGRWIQENPRALPDGFEWKFDNVSVYRQEGDLWSPYQVWWA